MIKELKNVRQYVGEPKRRWFQGENFDLIVWQSLEDGISGFQLCYKNTLEHSITWRKDVDTVEYHVVDDGNSTFSFKKSPILKENGTCPKNEIIERFNAACATLEDTALLKTIKTKLETLI